MPNFTITPCIADETLTVAHCLRLLRGVASPRDQLVCVARKTNKIVFTAVISDVLSNTDYHRLCEASLPNHIHTRKTPLGDCVWDGEGNRRLVPVEISAYDFRRTTAPNRVLVCEVWTYYGTEGPRSKQSPPKQGFVYARPQKQFLKNMHKVGKQLFTGDRYLDERLFTDYDSLPKLAQTEHGATNENGNSVIFGERLDELDVDDPVSVQRYSKNRLMRDIKYSKVFTGSFTYSPRRAFLVYGRSLPEACNILIQIGKTPVDVKEKFVMGRVGSRLELRTDKLIKTLVLLLPRSAGD